MSAPKSQIIESQKDYYRARAAEYDNWFFRRGRYDLGEAHTKNWNQEAGEVEAFLRHSKPGGQILEIAGGTGLWTRHLAPRADRLTVLDASPEVVAINKERVASANIDYHLVDIFGWRAKQQYDFIFFGFWLSHVPADRFDDFWAMVKSALKPGGKVFFVDSLLTSDFSETEFHTSKDQGGVVERKLADGRTFNIVKIFYQPDSLKSRLAEFGWRGDVRGTENFFIYGCLSI